MYLGYDERNSIVEFNKTSDKYRIEVRDYSQFDTAEDSTAGLTTISYWLPLPMSSQLRVITATRPSGRKEKNSISGPAGGSVALH